MKSQARYKRHFDARLRQQVTPVPGQYVFVNSPPAATTTVPSKTPSSTTCNRPPPKSRNLLAKTIGHYKVLQAKKSTVIVDVDGIPDTVSIDRITIDPQPAPASRLMRQSISTTSPTLASNQTPTLPDCAEASHTPVVEASIQHDSPKATTIQYPVERIDAHRQTSTGLKFKVRWFDCPPPRTPSNQRTNYHNILLPHAGVEVAS